MQASRLSQFCNIHRRYEKVFSLLDAQDGVSYCRDLLRVAYGVSLQRLPKVVVVAHSYFVISVCDVTSSKRPGLTQQIPTSSKARPEDAGRIVREDQNKRRTG